MANNISEPLHEHWKDYTEKEILEIQQSKCKNCKYHGKASFYISCDYLVITRHARGIRPELCEYYKDDTEVDRTAFGHSKEDVHRKTKKKTKKEEVV